MKNFVFFAQKLKYFKMINYLRKLHDMRLFSLQDATKIIGNESTAKSMLSNAIKEGTVCRIKSNLYAVTDLATSLCVANKYEIASHISATACVAYHSSEALNISIFNAKTKTATVIRQPYNLGVRV